MRRWAKNFVSGRLGLLFFFTIFLLQSSVINQASAQTTYTITNMSNTPNATSAFPAVSQGDLVTTYVAWVEYDGSGGASSLYVASIIAGNYSTPIKVTDDAGTNSEPIVAFVGSGGFFHFLFTNKDKRMEAVEATVTDSSATLLKKTFLSPEKVTETVPDEFGVPQQVEMDVRGFDPSMVVDQNGVVHAIWIDNREGVVAAKYHVFHKMYINGAWETGDREVAPRGSLQKRTSITVTSDNVVHAAMNVDGRMVYASYVNNNWRTETPPANGRFNLVTLRASDKTVHAVWSTSANGHSIFYAKNSGSGWSAPLQLDTNDTFDDFPSVVVSQYGQKVYGLWSSGNDSYYLNPVAREINPNGTLGDPIIIATNQRSNWVRGSGSGFSTYVVWQAKGTGNWEIFATDIYVEPTPPPPPCYKRENGKCLEIDTALGVICTKGDCIFGKIAAVLLSLSGGIGALIIMYGGYVILTSRGDAEKVQKGREIVVSFIIGIVFLIFAFFIFEFLTNDILNLPGFG